MMSDKKHWIAKSNPDNGNGEVIKELAQPSFAQNPPLMSREIAEQFLIGANSQDLIEPSMAGFAHGIHDDAKLDQYTEYSDTNDVLRMNTFEGCARTVSVNLFGNHPRIIQSVDKLLTLSRNHKSNMRAYKRKRSLESVSVARGGYDVVKNTKDLEKQLNLRH